jgi:eukaryotic-like serine/threonine-protein kinase
LMLGPYQILTPIGRGGMGSVYLALDTRAAQHVALKVLPPKKAREEERYLARFRREMELSQRVRHPHLALTYEVGVYQGVYYIAMEYIPGMSLHRVVSRQGPLPVARAARLFAEVCSGLDHSHGQGLIHRDLKPSNIMVTPNDHAKILDLGLALMEGEVADEIEVIGGQGYVVGSMDYIAPEQTENATAVDARADIYGLGCSLFYSLTGRPPFPGGNTRDKIKCHRHEEPEALTRLNPAVPDEFAGLVRKMMAKDPDKRFASAYDARGELLAWASGEPVLPMDQQNDQGFQAAIKALESGDLAEIGEVVILKADSSPGRPSDTPVLDGSLLFSERDERKQYLWIVVGMVGFWLVVLGILGLVVLLR